MNEATAAAIETYREFLANSQAQHERTIRQAYEQLQLLIANADPAKKDPPQSVWVTGNDGEQFLMLNKPAADLISTMIERLKDVVAELAKIQAKPESKQKSLPR